MIIERATKKGKLINSHPNAVENDADNDTIVAEAHYHSTGLDWQSKGCRYKRGTLISFMFIQSHRNILGNNT